MFSLSPRCDRTLNVPANTNVTLECTEFDMPCTRNADYELQSGDAAAKHGAAGPVRLLYHNKMAFKKYAKTLGVMDDFKSGVPRMAYRGVVSTVYKGTRVYVAPGLSWKGYDPTW